MQQGNKKIKARQEKMKRMRIENEENKTTERSKR